MITHNSIKTSYYMSTSKKYQSKTLNQDLPKQAKHSHFLKMFMSTRTTF